MKVYSNGLLLILASKEYISAADVFKSWLKIFIEEFDEGTGFDIIILGKNRKLLRSERLKLLLKRVMLQCAKENLKKIHNINHSSCFEELKYTQGRLQVMLNNIQYSANTYYSS